MFDKDYYTELFKVKSGDRPVIKYYYAYDMITTGLQARFGDNAVWLPEYQQIVDWLSDNKGDGLLVIGDSGLGKSVICRDIIPIILNEEKKYYSSSSYCDVMTAYQMAASGYDYNSTNAKVIMIDDIGTEGDYVQFGARRNMFAEIVDWAERCNKILIITSNLTPQKIKEKYGERTLYRLQSLCKAVKIEGNNLRQTNGGSFGIPHKNRVYGMDFNTQEEADMFAEDQKKARERMEKEEIPVSSFDRKEIEEGQPIKIAWNPIDDRFYVYALLKHDWNKYNDYIKNYNDKKS